MGVRDTGNDRQASAAAASGTTGQALAGTWQKLSQDSCAVPYPDSLIFKPGGIYQAPGAPESGKHWHGGDYELTTDGDLKVQMANDAMKPYRITALSAELLTIEDASGCQIRYGRVAA